MPAYYHELLESCHVEECMDRAARMMNWEEKFPRRDMGNGKVRGVGVGISMQAPASPAWTWELCPSVWQTAATTI